jgi:hypothetical protein
LLKNNWLRYFIYAVVLICYLTISNSLLRYLIEQRGITFSILPLMIWSTIIFTIFGVLLGLEKLVLEIRKEGKWKINLPKVIFLGVPSLYFSIGTTLVYSSEVFVQQTISSPIIFFIRGGSTNLLSVFQIVLGYVVVTSLFKKEDELLNNV